MQFIPGVGHVGLADQTAVAFRVGIDVHDANRVGTSILQRIDERDIRERLRRRLQRHRW